MNVMNAPTSATNAKSAKPMSDGGPQFGMPKMEMPAELGEMTKKGVAHARDAYAKAKVASEEATDLLQSTYATVAKGATAYNLKAFEIARTNTQAAFAYAHELLGVKSPSEFVELSTAHMRKQFDIASTQNKELCAVAQEVATDAAEQIKAGMSKAFSKST
jgi:phasin